MCGTSFHTQKGQKCCKYQISPTETNVTQLGFQTGWCFYKASSVAVRPSAGSLTDTVCEGFTSKITWPRGGGIFFFPSSARTRKVSVSLSKRLRMDLNKGGSSKQSVHCYFIWDLLGGLHIRKILIADIVRIIGVLTGLVA